MAGCNERPVAKDYATLLEAVNHHPNLNVDINNENDDMAMETNDDEIYCKGCRKRLTRCLINYAPETYVLICANKQCESISLISDAEQVSKLEGKCAKLKEPGLEDVDDVLQIMEDFKNEMQERVRGNRKKAELERKNKMEHYDEQLATYEGYLKVPFQDVSMPRICERQCTAVHQWENESNLCWLDALTTMLVNSDVIRVQLNLLEQPSILHYVCREFDRIQIQQQATKKDLMRFKQARQLLVDQFTCKFNIKIGKMQCCMEMLRLFLDVDDSIKPIFTSYVKRTLECKECEYSEIGNKKLIGCLSIPYEVQAFHPLKSQFTVTCPECNAPDQNERIEFQRISPIIVIHLEKGFPHNSLRKYDFGVTIARKQIKYQVLAVIQYKRNAKHFILWLRDINATHAKWIKFDDGIVKDLTRWRKGNPTIPLHEIHMIVWSKKNAGILSTQEQISQFLNVVDCRKTKISSRDIFYYPQTKSHDDETVVGNSADKAAAAAARKERDTNSSSQQTEDQETDRGGQGSGPEDPEDVTDGGGADDQESQRPSSNLRKRKAGGKGMIADGSDLAFFRKLQLRPPIKDDEWVSEERCKELRERAMKMRDTTYMRMSIEKFQMKFAHWMKVYELLHEEERKPVERAVAIPEQPEDVKDRSMKIRRIGNVVCIGYNDLEVPYVTPLPPSVLPKIMPPPEPTRRFNYFNKSSS